MISQETARGLRDLKLSAMAKEFESQMEMPDYYRNMSFEDRLGLLVDKEKQRISDNLIQKRIREAGFSCPDAAVEGIDYFDGRRIDRGSIMKLATCSYITEKHHLMFQQATSAGKTYLAYTLENVAYKKKLKVKYICLPDLLDEFQFEKDRGNPARLKKDYAKYNLTIIDEWLLRPLGADDSYDLLEIIDICCRKGSIIFCSQYDSDEWYYRIDCNRPKGEASTVAEAVLDRFIHNKYTINIDCTESMRKRYGLNGKDSL